MVNNFFAGLEEVASRLLSLVLTVTFFLIYILASANQELLVNWYKLLVMLSVFWLVYESLAYFFFSVFLYFGNKPRVNSKTSEVVIDGDSSNTSNIP